MSVMKLSVIFLALLAVAAPAHAYFMVVERQDDFTGEKGRWIYGASESARVDNEILEVMPLDARGKLAENPFFILNPHVPYLCGDTNDTVLVQWVAVGHDGKQTEVQGSRWMLDKAKTRLSTAAKIDTVATKLISAMLTNDKLKFRYVDECGKGKDFEFNLVNFKESAVDLERIKK
jgi:hypothetical protein